MQQQNVRYLEIDENNDQQRIDNFLITTLKNIPKSRIYRMLRKGEARVNKKRCKPKQRLQIGDQIRIPPVRLANKATNNFIPSLLKQSLQQNILFEDECLLVLNKPSGFAVHGGNNINAGIIESLRNIRPNAGFLELVHRLDRDTSGCLMIAKKRSALRQMHAQFRDNNINKTYQALLSGRWQRQKMRIDVPLLKNISKSGERMVIVSKQGKMAETLFRRIHLFAENTWVEVTPKTGRTHQIRVHAAFMGHAIVGDNRYGQPEDNLRFKANLNIRRLALHAQRLVFYHPRSGAQMITEAPLPEDLDKSIKRLYKNMC